MTKRTELLKELEGKLNNVSDIVLGLTEEGIYEISLHGTDYMGISSNIYNPFNTEVDDEDLYDIIDTDLYNYGFNSNLEWFLQDANIYKEDIINNYIENMTEDEKLERLHIDIMYNTEFYYNDNEYMLETVQCGQSYITEHNFISTLIAEEELNQLQNIWNNAHLKKLDVLTTEELQFLNNFIDNYSSNTLYNVLENDNFIEVLGQAYNL